MIEEAVDLPDGLTLRVWRLRGSGGGPAAHLQAGLHADEIPGMLVLHKLLPRLIADEAAGRLLGDVTVVPRCNPIGSQQFGHGRVLGRFDRATGHNFNRGFPEAATREGAVFAWQAALLRLVAPADIVLDLHTDDEGVPYLYVHRALWPEARDLAAALDADVVILWDGGGGGAFEDAVVRPWIVEGRVAGRICATVELRGQADVDDATAEADARALHRLLRARGVIAGMARLHDWIGEAVSIDCIETVRAPADGVLVFDRALGELIEADEPFARLVPEPGEPERDLAVRAPQTGRLFTRTRDRYVEKGGVVAKLTGAMPSATWSDQPLDD